MPRVSVVIPTYNNAQFVTQAVGSVLAQTYADFEVIVVDDGSVDSTQAVLASYSDRINCIYQENKGPAAARNTGLLASQGDYLLFLDSDDLVPPNKLELQIPLLEVRPDFGLVYSGWQYINEDGTQVLGEVRPNKQGRLLKELLRRSLVLSTTGVATVRRECFERVGLFDESLSLMGSEDADMWLRLARAGYAFGYVDQPLLQYRVYEGSLSTNIPHQTQSRFARLDKFFADPGLPDDIKALEAEVYSILHYETAARYYRAGEIELGRDHIRKAISTCPSLSSHKEWLLEWLAAVALEPQTDDPRRLLGSIFDNLPSEAITLRSLRRRAYGRYHTAAAFSAYQNQHIKKVRQHVLPALIGDPAIIRNRGFIRISLHSLVG